MNLFWFLRRVSSLFFKKINIFETQDRREKKQTRGGGGGGGDDDD